jgi:hypothetical protein
MTQAWNTAFNVGTAMTALTDQDVV